jgi:hypothetical protein
MGKRRKTNRTEWSDAEIHLLHSRYATYGPSTLSRHIKRTPEAIRAKANRLGLIVGDFQNWVPISYIAAETGMNIVSVRERARNSGFARTIRCNRIIVPKAWANAYINSAKKAAEIDNLIGYYYDIPTTAKIFKISQGTLLRWLSGESISGAKNIAKVKVVVSSGRTNRRYLFEPRDVEREAKAYHERKANPRHKLRSE